MTAVELQTQTENCLLNNYGPRRLAFVRGYGATLWDSDGREYLDFFAGIAVVNLGHCHPAVTEAIREQAGRLVHTSNLYFIENQVELAALLSEHTFADRWFFCNSGTEATEAAIKLFRRYWALKGTPKPVLVTAQGSFHGRTFAALSATAQPKYWEGFEPMMPGMKHVPYDDVAALESALTDDVGAVYLEPVQGEGGVNVPSPGYLKRVRDLCDHKNVLLMLDEIQTGMGRTGTLFAYEQDGIEPDVIAIAKGLGNGVPIGALGCTEAVASAFTPGSHGSTFGGNHLCTAAALATVRTLLEPGFLDHAAEMGNYLLQRLSALKPKHESVIRVRGKGLLVGVELTKPSAPIINAMADAGVICGPAGPNVIRFAPPLIITRDDIDRVVTTLDEILRKA